MCRGPAFLWNRTCEALYILRGTGLYLMVPVRDISDGLKRPKGERQWRASVIKRFCKLYITLFTAEKAEGRKAVEGFSDHTLL